MRCCGGCGCGCRGCCCCCSDYYCCDYCCCYCYYCYCYYCYYCHYCYYHCGASSKSRRSCFSASPTHLERTSAPLRMKKVTRRPPTLQVFATARATSVLPVPGGPWKSTWLGLGSGSGSGSG